MKHINISLILAACLGISSCNSDDISSESIFDTSSPARTEFDTWLKNNYTDTYNIDFNYLYNDKLTDNSYNVIPADIEKSKAIAILVKEVWMDAYTEVAGENFLKNNCFRQIQLVGSHEYSSQGSIVLGTAEGGLKVLLFGINSLDLDNVYINQDNPYRSHNANPMDLNFWYFHTMHHEFCHILTQQKNYSTDFQTISAGNYHSSDWVNVSDTEAPKEGFVTGYASGEYNEDFAETYATYVTNTDEGWNLILQQACDTLTDSQGNILYQTDSKGNYIYKTDANGNYVYKKNGQFLIPSTDANGNIVYSTDESGQYVYLTDADGNKIPMYKNQSANLYYYATSSGNIYVYSYIKGVGLYNVATTAPSDTDTPVYQTNEEGEVVYDAEGNPVIEYYKIPVFEYEKEPQVNTEGMETIIAKLDLVKSYFSETWGIDIEKLRKVVLERSKNVSTLDLKTLK